MGSEPLNADRGLWGALAIAQLDGSAAEGESGPIDAELVLSDLLADLMHWCDFQGFGNGRQQTSAFESALERARDYYLEECESELRRTTTSTPKKRRL